MRNSDMDTDVPSDRGRFEARYLAFLETVAHIRPRLHRYCARMTGSPFDGEDVVQDALFDAYRKLDSYDESRPLAPWLFRIAHHRAIDHLRRRGVREAAELAAAPSETVDAEQPVSDEVRQALERLVGDLPPMERACVLLKDVFEYSLEETADLVDSSVGGVKAALHRGRRKLEALASQPAEPKPVATSSLHLAQRYADGFNRRAWDELRGLIRADARIRVADRYAGRVGESPYFQRYADMPHPLRANAEIVGGEVVVVIREQRGSMWVPRSIVRLTSDERGAVSFIADYFHCDWLADAVAA
jgi:RNA polymerase sigma-70 factor (ECF subfamily)